MLNKIEENIITNSIFGIELKEKFTSAFYEKFKTWGNIGK